MALVYTQEELKDNTDGRLMTKLKEAWEYNSEKPLEVYGTVEEINSANGRPFYILDDIRHIGNDEKLRFPLDYEPRVKSVYTGNPSNFNLKHFKTGDKARVVLSSNDEREKYNNPFCLMALALDGLIHIGLDEEDFDFTKSTLKFIEIDEDKYLESFLYELHLNKAFISIEKETEAKKKELENKLRVKEQEIDELTADLDAQRETLEGSNDHLKVKLTELEEQKDAALQELSQVQENLLVSQDVLNQAETKYENFLSNLDKNMANLNEILKSKAEILKGSSLRLGEESGSLPYELIRLL